MLKNKPDSSFINKSVYKAITGVLYPLCINYRGIGKNPSKGLLLAI